MLKLPQLSSPGRQGVPRSMDTQSRMARCRPFWLSIAILGMALAIPAQADIPAGERAVLLALYASTGGANWTSNTGWNGPPGTECVDWQSVVCDAGHNHVTEIQIAANNLTGTLPSLSGLTELQTFQAVNNHLTGRIPPLAGLTKLRLFLVNNNQLSGPVPALAGLGALVNFTAHSNQLTGSIPQLTGLSSLLVINVHSNRLSGSVPSLAGLALLRGLTLYNNQFSGYMPDVPHPNDLRDATTLFCVPNDGNGFAHSPNADWDRATGFTPWYTFCDATPDPVSVNGFD